MYSFRKSAFALLLILLIVLAGCQNPANTASQGAINGESVSLSSIASVIDKTPEAAGSLSNPKNTSAQLATKTLADNQLTPSLVKVSSSVTMGKVSALRMASAESGWIGGDGWIARTDDGGKHWKIQYHGSGIVKQIFALNNQDAWAVTDKAKLLSTSNGGEHWVLTGKMPNEGFLHFVSKNEAFSGNARTTNGGKNWSTLPVPKQTVGDAYFHDKNNGWAVIQNNGMGIVERTQDGGKTWKIVMGLKLISPLNGAVIRSAGTDDAWVEWIGDYGMTQNSYSLFHTSNGGKNWQTVLANSTAGGGPAPGFQEEFDGPKNQGSSPGPLYVLNHNVAYMGGDCQACDKPNTVGRTIDGGKTWVNEKVSFPGFGGALLAFSDINHGWWICTDNSDPSVLYTTSDGGTHWKKIYTFPRPKQTS
ncbi:hypothetical protein PASE110613_12950 [Paenibacillus sediminis]|uniref:Photosystem II stability/assembly factor-like uncharacterized protein n=1 Tax=Paenibacillus sediminis TaxID=664909 RepID=A0ABS4H4V2_9BACL|nr:hypothetical protein [Paenibacillus sediminis]MBP1937563.1 photosystem II stability/assembly factor-like uncharacterized protein [Paenibacillus sediminis]